MRSDRLRVLFEDSDDNIGYDWVVTYHLGYSDFDDDLEGKDSVERAINAPDFDTAVKYAQQYLRKMQTEEETAEEWADAQILSIQLH